MESIFRDWLATNYPRMVVDTNTYNMLYAAYKAGRATHYNEQSKRNNEAFSRWLNNDTTN